MRQALKRRLFAMLGKDPEPVIVSFLSGSRPRALAMIEEILGLEPSRRHFAVTFDASLKLPDGVTPILLHRGPAPWLAMQLRRALSHRRIGLAPVLFDQEPYGSLHAAAFLIAPRRILAYNANLERHHLRLSTVVASLLFLSGVPLDRIFLRPRWLAPRRRDVSWVPSGDNYGVTEGRAFTPGRRRIAIVTPYYPYPLSHGGAVRIYNLLRELAREFDILLLAFAPKVRAEHLPPVEQFCSRIFVVPQPRYREPHWSTLDPPEVNEFRVPLMRSLIERARNEFKAELVQLEYTSLASYPGDILVEHDVTFDLYQQLHQASGTLLSAFNLWRWKRFEKAAVRRFRRIVVMSDKDAGLLKSSNVRVVPNGVDLKRFQPKPETPGGQLLFVGSFRHFPNVSAMRFLLDRVWPLLTELAPDVKLTVVAGPDPELYWKQHAGSSPMPSDPRVRILGMTRDVRPFLIQANVVLVPTLVSAGTNLKVIEAMAMERAVVSTTSGAAGLGLEHGANIWIADGGREFADGIAKLLSDDPLRTRLAASARRFAVEHFDWQVIGARYREMIRAMLPPRSAIRAATPIDLQVIEAIQAASPEAAHWECRRYLDFDSSVAVVDGAIRGFIVTRRTAPDETEVLNLAVDPDHRRMGIAGELMRHAIGRSPGEVFLEVRESNLPARKLYSKLGFEDAGVRQNYYQDPPEAAIVMRLRTC